MRKVTRAGLEPMRQRFNERYQTDLHCLIRLTEAQEEYFGELDNRMSAYRAVTTPTLIMPGAQDRAIPLWAQKKMLDVFPHSRWLTIPECGHVAYLEQPTLFFGTLKAFMRAKTPAFERPA